MNLVGFPYYNVHVTGAWRFDVPADEHGFVRMSWNLPDANANYDGLVVLVDDEPVPSWLDGNRLLADLAWKPGSQPVVELKVHSRGLREFVYVPGPFAKPVDLRMTVTTDFADLDFPEGSMAPTSRERAGEGWRLTWEKEDAVPMRDLGVVLGDPVQPRRLATHLAFSGMWSFFLLTTWLTALAVGQRIDLHPLQLVLLAVTYFVFYVVFATALPWFGVVGSLVTASVVGAALAVGFAWKAWSQQVALADITPAVLVTLVGFSAVFLLDTTQALAFTISGVLTLVAALRALAGVDWANVLKSEGAER